MEPLMKVTPSIKATSPSLNNKVLLQNFTAESQKLMCSLQYKFIPEIRPPLCLIIAVVRQIPQ